jgi:hypothetical protein
LIFIVCFCILLFLFFFIFIHEIYKSSYSRI